MSFSDRSRTVAWQVGGTATLTSVGWGLNAKPDPPWLVALLVLGAVNLGLVLWQYLGVSDPNDLLDDREKFERMRDRYGGTRSIADAAALFETELSAYEEGAANLAKLKERTTDDLHHQIENVQGASRRASESGRDFLERVEAHRERRWRRWGVPAMALTVLGIWVVIAVIAATGPDTGGATGRAPASAPVLSAQ